MASAYNLPGFLYFLCTPSQKLRSQIVNFASSFVRYYRVRISLQSQEKGVIDDASKALNNLLANGELQSKSINLIRGHAVE